MKLFTERLYHALEKELYSISIESIAESEKLKMAVKACRKSLSILKRFISSYFFSNQEEEICFFKELKPLFYSQYIYYISIYNFQIKKPVGSKEDLNAYITSEIDALKRFFDHNQSFFQYYRMCGSHFDSFYFTRCGLDLCTDLEDYQADEMFSTSHDYKLSKIIANERYQEYLQHQISIAEGAAPSNQCPIIWTSNQTDLIELIYALAESGAINNGNVEIKHLIENFQTLFQVDLHHYYRKYTDITNRKKERTVFLDKLKIGLIRRMEEKYQWNEPQVRKIH
ncbi:RteC domain-containing protein [Pedobacter sp. P351]|uniref:RteC domain-containing protein n=1 Tax=Pedobacter superstes TaxID=3133441 RepID=UPI0030B5E7A6